MTGISIGAINSGIVSEYPMGQELPMSTDLVGFWRNITGNSDFYKEWNGGLLEGLLFQQGLYDSSPSNALSRRTLTKPIARNVTVGSTNVDTGLFETFSENLGPAFVDAIGCSASPPLYFPPQQFEAYTWIDGGCIINLDVFSAIERCLEVTNNEAEIVADLIYCNQYNAIPPETELKTLDVFSRAYEIRSYDSSLWYSYNAMVAYPNVDFRYIIIPTVPLSGGTIPLNFTPSNLESEIQQGINDTIAALSNPKSGRTIISELYHEKLKTITYA